MGMFDYINGHQVKCLECELNSYSTGDKIDLMGTYPKNVLFLEDRGYDDNPFSRIVHIIKDSVVIDSISVNDLSKVDLSSNEGVYLDNGREINAISYEDIFNYLYDEAKYQLDETFAEHKEEKEKWELIDKLYEDFRNKWYK